MELWVAGGYAALLLGSLAALGIPQPRVILRWGIAAGFAFSAYLTATQAFLIGSYCIYCLTSASLMTALMLLTLTAARSLWQAFSKSAFSSSV